MSDDVIRCLIIGAVWIVGASMACWALGGAAKLGGTEDQNEKSRACGPALDTHPEKKRTTAICQL